MQQPTAPDVQPEGTSHRSGPILAGEPFRYDMVSYALTPEGAKAEVLAWANRPETQGAGSALYGRTVAVRAGEPYRIEGKPEQWGVPVWWVVATHLPQPTAVEALRPGMLVHLEREVVRITSPAWGVPSASREIGVPRISVHAYASALGAQGLDAARHLDWPAGTLVQAARP